VTDARATMAIYRLNRGQWEKGYAAVPIRVQRNAKAKAQLKASRERESIGPEGVARRRKKASPPSKTRSKGVSSGLSTIVRRKEDPAANAQDDRLKAAADAQMREEAERIAWPPSRPMPSSKPQMKDKGGTDGTKVKWWSELAGTGDGSKGRISVTA
jgi:hypothetical protein